jgi:hypothetical protein
MFRKSSFARSILVAALAVSAVVLGGCAETTSSGAAVPPSFLGPAPVAGYPRFGQSIALRQDVTTHSAQRYFATRPTHAEDLHATRNAH